MSEETTPWWLYLIRMANGNLYCGVTIDVERRFSEHCSNTVKSAKALRNKGPLQLVYTYQAETKRQAMQLEYALKQWPKARKELLIKQPQQVVQLFEAIKPRK